jgi:hypothetical protein
VNRMLSQLVQAGIALTRKRPSHKLTGIGRFSSIVIPEMNCNRGVALRGTFESQSLQRSNFELLAFTSYLSLPVNFPGKSPAIHS